MPEQFLYERLDAAASMDLGQALKDKRRHNNGLQQTLLRCAPQRG